MVSITDNDLTLGFVGEGTVRPANARALLADEISAHLKTFPKARVRFLIPIDSFTDAMEDLADFCMTSGYDLGLTGKSDDQRADAYKKDAARVFESSDGSKLLVQQVLPKLPNPRLIIIGDTGEDLKAYKAVEFALQNGIKVRSLQAGLDEIVWDDEDSQDSTNTEEDVATDEWDDAEAEETDEIDFESLGQSADEGGDDAMNKLIELATEAEFDPDDYPTWAELATALAENAEGNDEEPEEESEGDEEPDDEEGEDEGDEGEPEDEEPEDEEETDEEAEEDETDEESEDESEIEDETDDETEDDEDAVDWDDEENEEEAPVPRRAAASKSSGRKLSERELVALSENDREKFYRYAAKYGVKPGRGIRTPGMIKSILEATGQRSSATTASRTTAKKTTRTAKKTTRPAKKAAAGRGRPVTPGRARAASKTARPAKKAATSRTAKRSTSARKTTAAPRRATSTGNVNKAAVRRLIEAAIEVAQSL